MTTPRVKDNDRDAPNNGVEFGWGAPRMIDQHPVLLPVDAEHFDKDNMAIVRLHLRNLITDSQRDAAFQKLTRAIAKAIRAALSQASE